MEMYEEKNTRLLHDVNAAEDDFVKQNSANVREEKQKLQTKLDQANLTIKLLKQRKIELTKKNDFFSAPKREILKKKEDQKD